MAEDGIIYVQGRKVNQRKLRKFLEEIDPTNIDQFRTEDGKWQSPITGELFRTKYQLWGQLGAYLRTVDYKNPYEPTRAGYVRALRRGLDPTPEQKLAHSQYNKAFRRKRRDRILLAKGEEPDAVVVDTEEEPIKRVPAMSWD